jgi:spore germination protein KA
MGQTIGIVGTLVIGESAVRANLTSNVTVIVIATTAVAQFTVPPGFTTTIRLLRLPLLVLGSSLGLYGVFAGTILILLHVASLRCVGLPYLYPYSPLSTEDLGDASIRLPWWTHTKRPVITAEANVVRIPPGQAPEPPEDEGSMLELETRRQPAGRAPDKSPWRRTPK